MIPMLEEKREDLHRLCRQHEVQRLEVFGSAATEQFDPATSDLDFLVEFDDAAPDRYADRFFSLLEGLQALFGRPVDLVVDSAISNPYFRASVDKSRIALYAA